MTVRLIDTANPRHKDPDSCRLAALEALARLLCEIAG
jgi:hypothetical protein